MIHLVTTHFETLDLISCQPSGFVDFIKVNARVSVSSHGVCPCVLSFCWELLLCEEQDRENRYEMTGPLPCHCPGPDTGAGSGRDEERDSVCHCNVNLSFITISGRGQNEARKYWIIQIGDIGLLDQEYLLLGAQQ